MSVNFPKSDAKPATGSQRELTAANWNVMCQQLVDMLGSLITTEALGVSKAGAVGDDTDPQFKWIVHAAGINRAEMGLYFRNASMAPDTWIKIWGTEATGTSAAVRDGTLGSALEVFRRDGAWKPTSRLLNSYPTPGIELMANGGQVSVGELVRSSGVVTATTRDSAGNLIAHGFGVGQTVYDPAGETKFASGSKVVASVPAGHLFTYTEAGLDAVSTIVHDFSAEFDVEIRRVGPGQLGLYCSGNLVALVYPDALVMQHGSLLVHSTDTGLTAHVGGGQANATQLVCELNYIENVASDQDSAKLVFAGAGREIVVFNLSSHVCSLYPQSGAQIDQLGTDAALDLVPGASRVFYGYSSTQWYSR